MSWSPFSGVSSSWSHVHVQCDCCEISSELLVYISLMKRSMSCFFRIHFSMRWVCPIGRFGKQLEPRYPRLLGRSNWLLGQSSCRCLANRFKGKMSSGRRVASTPSTRWRSCACTALLHRQLPSQPTLQACPRLMGQNPKQAPDCRFHLPDAVNVLNSEN